MSTNRSVPAMAMLPNDQHPSPGCSCRQCLVQYPAPRAEMIDVTRIYRAQVEAHGDRDVERTVFVRAGSRHSAFLKIANVIAAVEGRTADEALRNRIYNLSSGRECIAEGMSDDLELRLFETGWTGIETYYTTQPLFALDCPALVRKWAETPVRA